MSTYVPKYSLLAIPLEAEEANIVGLGNSLIAVAGVTVQDIAEGANSNPYFLSMDTSRLSTWS